MNKPRILFITPINHLRDFYSEVFKAYEFLELLEPTYDDVKLHIGKFDILFCAPNFQNFVIDEELIKDSNIQCIVSPSTGLNHIDVDSVPIISIKNDEILESIWSTAEHTLHLILSIVRHTEPSIELHDKTLGIIGDGRLGKMVEYLCQNLFKKVIVVDKDYGDKEKLFFESDIVSLHVDLNPSSYEMINKNYMQQFRKDIYLVNTSRGEIVNEEDINELLLKDRICGYATDVLQTEYVDEQSILESNHKVLITPHIAGTSIEAQEKAYQRVLEKI
jgi:D-3-phosphoglycerate dehydrogenase|tara:strand:+ start:468 stop:1295 length:828 start_codon:yes stop_codon:yes gene_type:complete